MQTATRLIMAKDANLVIIFIYLVSLMCFFQAKKKKQPMLHFVHRNVITCSLGKNHSNKKNQTNKQKNKKKQNTKPKKITYRD